MSDPSVRLLVSAVALAAWLSCLLLGLLPALLSHLFLLAALVAWPWRRQSAATEVDTTSNRAKHGETPS